MDNVGLECLSARIFLFATISKGQAKQDAAEGGCGPFLNSYLRLAVLWWIVLPFRCGRFHRFLIRAHRC